MLRIGYVRRRDLSTAAELAAEAEALKAAGCAVVRIEAPDRTPNAARVLHTVLDALNPGDELIVGRLEQVGPDSRAMLEVLDRLEAHGASLRVVKPPLSTHGAGAAALRAALEAVTAIEPGAVTRPRRSAAPHEIQALQEAGLGPVEIARRLGVSRMTVWRKLKALDGCQA